jgi:hypothetical protein
MKRVLTALLVLVVLGTAGIADAQVRATGVIQGKVVDDDGVALPGVMVTVEGPALIGTQTAYTGSDGSFRVPLLPRGDYTVTFALQGFATLVNENIEVGVQRTSTLEVQMSLSSVEETITVTGRSPIVDIKTTKRSSDYSDELRNALPESRGVGGDLMNLAPEATPGGGSTTASGSNFFGDNSVAYLIDGVNVTDPSGGSQFPFYSPDFFDVVELTAIGGAADSGKYQGVAFNVVTKSGGNEFHGEGNFFYQNNAFINDNTAGINAELCPDTLDCFEPPTIDYRYDGTFGVGGPLIRDKAWFFASYQGFYESDTVAGVSYPVAEDSDRFLGKVTYQADADNRLIGSVMSDTYTIYGRPSSRFRTKDQTGLEPSMNITPNITWNSVLSPDAFLEVKYSGFYGYFDLVPFVELPSFQEDTTNIFTGGYYGHIAEDRSRSNVQGSLSYFAEDFAGDHSFKFGAEWERNTTVSTFQYNASLMPLTVELDGVTQTFAAGALGVSYITYLGDPYLAYIYQPSRSRATSVVTPFTLYGQDDWTIGNRLTLNLGLRYDRWSMGFKGGPGLDNLPLTHDVAPRIGANLDLMGDGRTSLNAFWGRFYEEFHGTTINDFDPQQATYYCLEWTGAEYTNWCRDNPLTDVGFDPDLTNQYADQFVVGIDHQLTEDLAVTARYIRKDNKNMLGGEDIGSTFVPVEVTDIDGKTHTLFNPVGGLDTFRRLTNNPNERFVGKSFREYNGVQFKATKRMSDNWSLIGSVLIQKSEGNNFNDTGSLAATDDPNDFAGWPGESSNSRRFVSKIQGSYDYDHPIFGAQFGWIVNWLSGGRTQRTQRFTRYNLPGGGTAPFERPALTVPIDQRGTDTFPAQFKLDLRADKQFELNRGWGTLGLVFDIFNVFNDDTVVGYNSTRVELASFYEPDTIIQPRIWRLGLRWQF